MISLNKTSSKCIPVLIPKEFLINFETSAVIIALLKLTTLKKDTFVYTKYTKGRSMNQCKTIQSIILSLLCPLIICIYHGNRYYGFNNT